MLHRSLPLGACLAMLVLVPAVRSQHVSDDAPVYLPEVAGDPPSGLAPLDERLPRTQALTVSLGAYDSVQVNVDGNGDNIVGDAANEPSIAVDPTDGSRIVIGWRQFDSITSNFRQAGWSYSHDGGASWTFPGVLDPGVFRSDPVLDTDAQGNFYYQSLKLDFNMDVYTSTDGGATWGPPVPSFGGDKNWMAIDATGGQGDGHVYGIWQRFFGCCDVDTFTRSVDGAASFQTPVEVPLNPAFGILDVGPDGEVWAVGIEGTFGQDFDQIVASVTNNADDAGQTPGFTGFQIDLGGSLDSGEDPNPAGLMGQVNVAVDHSTGKSRGNVYVLAAVDPPGSDNADVYLARSRDGGANWSAPIRVNDDAQDADHWQWLAAHSVAPNGRIDVIWNDTRDSEQANISELYYAWSYDEGDTWQGNIPVSPAFDSHLGWPNQSKIGDYYTIVSDATGADVAYAATFNGEQDVYYLRVFPDCNGNGVSDETDIDLGSSFDCNANGILDTCDIANGTSTDSNGNSVPDECEGLWVDLGGGTPGVNGVPLLVGSGPLTAGSTLPLELTQGPPSALALLWFSTTSTPVAIFGGTLHAFPFAEQFLVGTTGSGGFLASTVFPPGVPPATPFWFQFLLNDVTVPAQITLSSAVRGTTP